MKKFTLFIILLAIATMAFGQAKVYKGVSVATATTKLGTNLFTGDHVYCTATGNEYILKANQGANATVTTIIASGNYTLLQTSTATPTFTTLTTTGLATLPWIHATHTLITNDSVANLVASTLAKAPTVTATTTLTLPGTTTITKTSGNGNSATFSHSAVVTDTLTAGVIDGTTKIYTPSLAATTILTLPGTSNTVTKTTGNANSVSVSNSMSVLDTLVAQTATITGTLTSSSLTRGSAAFSGSLTRVAVYVPGITNTSYVLVQPTAPTDAFTRPVAGDFCNVKIVNDSIIVMRQAGTTADLAFDWFRIK